MTFLPFARYTLELPITIDEAQKRIYEHVGPYIIRRSRNNLYSWYGLQNEMADHLKPYNGFISDKTFEIYKTSGAFPTSFFVPAIMGTFFTEGGKQYLHVKVCLPLEFEIFIGFLAFFFAVVLLVFIGSVLDGGINLRVLFFVGFLSLIYGMFPASISVQKGKSLTFFKNIFRSETN